MVLSRWAPLRWIVVGLFVLLSLLGVPAPALFSRPHPRDADVVIELVAGRDEG